MRAAVRPAEPAEAAFLADSWHAMSTESGIAPDGFAAGWRERLAACFAAGIRDRTQGWFLAIAGDAPAGCAAAFLRPSEIGEVMHRRGAVLAGVYVAPQFRRRGIARALVTRAIAWSRERGCTYVSLRSSASAETLYRTLGFEDERSLILNLK